MRYIWIIDIEISSLSFSILSPCSFLFEVNIAVIAWNWFYLVSCLSETGSSCKWIGSNSSRVLEVLSLQHMGPNCNWLLLGVISLRNSHPKLIIRILLHAPPSAVLHNKLLVSFIQTSIGSIHSFHHSPSNHILLVVLRTIGASSWGLKIPLLSCSCFFGFLLLDFFSNAVSDLNSNKFQNNRQYLLTAYSIARVFLPNLAKLSAGLVPFPIAYDSEIIGWGFSSP